MPVLLFLLLPIAALAESAFSAPVGFTVSLFADDDLAHDIFALTIDSQGQVVVAGKNYIKRLFDDDGDGKADRAELISPKPASGAHGLLFDGDALIATGDNAIMRIEDGSITTLDTLSHREHGANGLARGPDGWIYLICGNDAGVGTAQVRSPTSPVKQPETGALVRYSPDFKTSEVVAHGFRNPYDIAFNAHGHVFTYDADGERDHYLPWYIPTRIYDIAIGQHHGWVLKGWKQSWARPEYFPDNVPRMVDIGRGSPTGVATYRHRRFPARYREGVFAICWTLGRVYFCPTQREGNGYRSHKEVFLRPNGSTGFAPVDLAVDPQGDMYIAVGGRGTGGGVYRIRHQTPYPAPPDDPLLDADQPLSAWSRARWLPLADARGPEALLAVAVDESASTSHRMRAIEILVDRFDGIPADFATRIAKSANEAVVARLAWANRAAARGLTHHQSPWVQRAVRAKLVGTRFQVRAKDQPLTFDRPTLTAVRQAQLLLGDIDPKPGQLLDTGYSAQAPKALPGVAAWRAQFPTNDTNLDRELARLFAMLEAPLLTTLAEMWTVESEPEDDIHYLLSAARMPGPRTPQFTQATAAALARLHSKMEARNYHVARNWPRHVKALCRRLCELDPALPRALYAHPDFGHIEHTDFVDALPESLKEHAISSLLASGKWSQALLEVAAHRPLDQLRPAWQEPDLHDSLLRILARAPTVIDKERFLEGVNSPMRNTAKASREALAALGVPVPEAKSAKTPAEWATRLQTIEWSTGNAKRGRTVYEQRACASCHDGSRRLGPALKGIGKRFSRDDLFAHILDPSAAISPLYKAWQVVTKSGQVHVGVPVYDSPAGTILETGPGTSVRFTNAEVERFEPVSQSPMPAGLLEGLSDTELADFHAYLSGL